jgi:Fe-S cluster biogenesis protein NfuA
MQEITTTSAIQVTFESTPNPSTLKFLFNQAFLQQTHNFETSQDAAISPLASKLFGFPWTSRVFLGPDFVSVTKQDWVDWDVLAEPLAGLIKEHLERGEPLVHELEVSQDSEEDSIDDSEIVRKIKHILKAEIKPVVALDGGDVSFASYKDGILAIQMKGACSGCPSSTATLKEGIEVRFKELLPEIKEVISI